MRRDVVEIALIKVELARNDIVADRMLQREIAIGGEGRAGVVDCEFHAVLPAIFVIERRHDDGRPELALVDQIL